MHDQPPTALSALGYNRRSSQFHSFLDLPYNFESAALQLAGSVRAVATDYFFISGLSRSVRSRRDGVIVFYVMNGFVIKCAIACIVFSHVEYLRATGTPRLGAVDNRPPQSPGDGAAPYSNAQALLTTARAFAAHYAGMIRRPSHRFRRCIAVRGPADALARVIWVILAGELAPRWVC